MSKILEQKDKNFINIELKHKGYAFYAIRKTLLDALNELKPRVSGKVVDLGCGIMPYKELLLHNNKISDYIGIDLKDSDYHNSIKPDIFWDGITIPLESGSCDWIIATEFLEHYHETEHILNEIFRVLRKGGTLFFTVPCIWPLHEVPYDEYRFTPYSLRKYFEKSNYSDIDIKALGGIDISLAIMYGLWLDNSGIKGLKKRFFRKIFLPIFRMLLKKDRKNMKFENGDMPSGLYGFITK